MGAGEHQQQAIIGHRGLARRRELVGDQPQMIGRALAAALPAGGVDQLAPRHRHQPRFRALGDAARRPIDQRRRKRLGQGVLGAGDVAGARSEEGDELAVAAARHRLGGIAGRLVTFSHPYIAQTGRTSIAP